MRHAAFLRGINVGGKHKLPMADLRAMFEAHGAADVASYVQSGNVAFDASAKEAKRIAQAVADDIEATFGFAAPIVLRTARELAAAAEASPFVVDGADPKTLAIGFLSARPRPAAVKALDPDRSPGDSFEIIGREVHLWLPNGAARSKLTNAWFDTQLGVVTTVRNWRTVNAMIDLT